MGQPAAVVKLMDAEKLRAMLRRKFPKDQYAMLYEVRNAAGFAANRSCDVIMIGLWPSRGCAIEGMELKVSRTDWLRELKNPAKAEEFVKYCDFWWVVAGNDTIVRPEELPPGWGLMVPRSGGLGIEKQAHRRDCQHIDRSFLAAMMKRATMTSLDSPEIKAVLDLEKESVRSMADKRVEQATARAESSLRELRHNIARFEEASGIKMQDYNGARIGEAVNAVLKGEHEWRIKELGRIRRQAAELHEWCEKNLPEEKTT